MVFRPAIAASVGGVRPIQSTKPAISMERDPGCPGRLSAMTRPQANRPRAMGTDQKSPGRRLAVDLGLNGNLRAGTSPPCGLTVELSGAHADSCARAPATC